jgi:hypothetical protein
MAGPVTRLRRASAVLCFALLAGCATPSLYQPLNQGAGYSEQRLESNRYRVRFSGNSATSRETVENYLMYRAAEITLQYGYDWFVIADRMTNVDPQQSGASPNVGIGLGTSSGHVGTGVSIGLSSLFGGGPSNAYSAQADIVVFRGTKPADDPRAIDARTVKANLEAAIQRPAKKT